MLFYLGFIFIMFCLIYVVNYLLYVFNMFYNFVLFFNCFLFNILINEILI
jgi:hypothetical protein